MEPVEQERITSEEWDELVGDEPVPWGGVGEALEWRDKDQHVIRRDADARLLAVAASAVVEVDVEDHGRFEVVGMGSLFVRASARGEGLVHELAQELIELARARGPRWAMLFCREELIAVYRKFGFAPIVSPVWADQSNGRIEMPIPAMVLAFEPGAAWPEGRVDVLGLPF